MKEKKPAMSFRIGDEYRKKLAEIAEFQDESQTEIMRNMIDVTHKAMRRRIKEREKRRAEREVLQF